MPELQVSIPLSLAERLQKALWNAAIFATSNSRASIRADDYRHQSTALLGYIEETKAAEQARHSASPSNADQVKP